MELFKEQNKWHTKQYPKNWQEILKVIGKNSNKFVEKLSFFS